MLEYLGYLASIIVLVSLLMSSAKKLRWINLMGSLTFAVYGFLIDAIPVGALNIATTFINLYYLYKMYNTKDYFKTLPIDKNSVYLKHFLKFYKDDISNFFSTHEVDVDNSDISFYILRNVVPAGFFVANKYNENTLRIDFDYVIPTYRDSQIGKYIFKNKKDIFLSKGFNSLITFTESLKHEKYLKKMGFYKVEADSTEEKLCYRIDIA
ncbi:hypothetical protein RJI07_09050 [Mycoplasmatota bacterium WC30]